MTFIDAFLTPIMYNFTYNIKRKRGCDMSNILITGKDLTLEQIAAICRGHAKIELAEEAKQNIIESRKVVDT